MPLLLADLIYSRDCKLNLRKNVDTTARLAEAKRKASQQKRKEENQHKYMMGGIVHKYFPECYQFDEQELNRIIASGMKSEQCQRIIEIVKKESAEKRENAVVKAESEVAGDEGTGKSENA